MAATSVPVLLYHRINYDNDVLSIPPELFEAHLKYLKEEGYVSIDKQELAEFMKTGKKSFDKAILITFDDGYLDTWVYAYPLLKKYGFKAILFVVTWNVEEDEFVGLNLDDYYSGRIPKERLPDCSGQIVIEDGAKKRKFPRLCWMELRQMEQSGVFDIQPHSKFHRKVYASDSIVDFNRPRDRLSAWHMVKGDERYGTPDFHRKPELAARQFEADKELRDELAEYVATHGYIEFFKTAQWREKLESIVDNYTRKNGRIGKFETDEQMKMRIRTELDVARGEVGWEMKKRCDAFAWPWGAYNDTSLEIAKSLGYRYLFTTRAGSNGFGDSPLHIKRFGVWKKDLDWFKSRIRLYSNKLLAKAYGAVYRKI